MVRISAVLKPLHTQLTRSTVAARRGLDRSKHAVDQAARRSRRLLHR